MTADDWVPPLELLEASADGVRREVDRLLVVAGEELRHVQDCDAELVDVPAGEALPVRRSRHMARHRLRAIARQLTVAACELVPATDESRFAAAQRIRSWAADGQRADPPYLEAVS